MNRWRAGVLAVCMVLLAVVLTLPAALLQRFLPQQLTVSAIDGSAWQGQLFNLQWQGQDLVDELNWQWHPLALLWLDLDLEITTRRHDQAGHADLEIGVFSALFHDWQKGPPDFTLSQMDLVLPLGPLAAAAPPIAGYQLRGDVGVRSTAFAWSRNGGKGELQLDWRNASSQLSGDARMGSYSATLKASERGYLIRLITVDGPLQLQGDGSGNPQDGWSGGVTIQAPKDQFATFQGLLAHFGLPGPDGSYRLRYSFKGSPHLPDHF